MLIDRACQITGIRMSELNRVSITALKAVIKSEKANPEIDYICKKYTKAEYVEAYETILTAVENN